MTKIVNISGAEITDTGIQRLVEYCRDTLTDNYTLIIGCLPYNSEIDAILIGNGNIYAVECKHWKGEIEGSTYGHWTKDGETISNPLHQTRNNTVALAKWLREKTGLNGSLWVRGLLVFTHDHCQVHITRDNGSNNGVEVILLGDLKGYLERQERTVKEEVVSRVVGVFEGIENINYYYNMGGQKKVMSKKEKIAVVCIIITVVMVVICFLSHKFFEWEIVETEKQAFYIATIASIIGISTFVGALVIGIIDNFERLRRGEKIDPTENLGSYTAGLTGYYPSSDGENLESYAGGPRRRRRRR